ncbi:hypothetical protein OJ997_24525 [Solirubrobacter phytolaccae]|uniref:Uncharacterized protein n=1 Tax=Solirubrobacter phytolaccae TaxID=1404360 RepID=A0A9X3SHU5_9ACTN|nr:hypothetical protein [Solirubrobacter phytolaccae]MDA0183497.1 hypothetical protein [Solirubrobacter phytolaccae]
MDRRRLSLLISAALLLVPASAEASFTEAPAYDFVGEPSCLNATGLPGEVAIGSKSGARFLQATRTGFVAAGEVKAGEGFDCSTIEARPSGAGVIAGTQFNGDSVVAVVRDPGGAWSAPLTVAAREGWTPQTVTAAVSDRGDVIVAWVEERMSPEPGTRIRVAQRAPGQGFGPAKVVQTLSGFSFSRTLDVAVSNAGEGILSWTALDASAKGPVTATASTAIVAPDGTVGAPTVVTTLDRSAFTSLSVAADGRALLAFTTGSAVMFAERAPGGAFGAPVKLAGITDPSGGTAIARLHDSGAAAIAWAGGFGEVRIATRPGLGGFRPPVTVAKAERLPKGFDPFWFSPAFLEIAGGGLSFLTPGVMSDSSLILTADGRALLGFANEASGAERSVARLATVPLTGAAPATAGAGGELDVPTLAQPLVLADGSPALTWVSNVNESRLTLHLAAESATRPAPGPTPRVRFGAPTRRVLDHDDSLRLPVSCSAACTVRAEVLGSIASEGVMVLYRSGESELSIDAGLTPLRAPGRQAGARARPLRRDGRPRDQDRDVHRARHALAQAGAAHGGPEGRPQGRLDPGQLAHHEPAAIRGVRRVRQHQAQRPWQPVHRPAGVRGEAHEVVHRDAGRRQGPELRDAPLAPGGRSAATRDRQGPLMRTALLVFAFLAAAPATASAALGQVEPVKVVDDEGCLGATGTPGELSASVRTGVRFLQATREGLKPIGTVKLSNEWFDCEAVATRASGAGVIVGRDTLDNHSVSVRDPGGAWSAPVPLPAEKDWGISGIGAAVSDRGDVLITWREDTIVGGKANGYRFRALRRTPGAPFAAPETIGAQAPRLEHVSGALAATTGEALVLTTRIEGDGARRTAPVSVATAAPGVPFGAPSQVATASAAAKPLLAVAPDGRALVVAHDGRSIQVAERPPGGAFGPPAAIGEASDPIGVGPAVAIGPSGEASVAWTGYLRGTVQFVARPAAGAPWASSSAQGNGLFPPGNDPFLYTPAFVSALFGVEPFLFNEAPGRLQLTAGGRAALAWQSALATPALVSTPLAGGPATLQPSAPVINGAGQVFAATLTDGTAALAWTEPNEDGSNVTSLHLAAEGVVERRDPAPPRVTVGAPLSRRLGPKEPLRIPVSCGGPCVVRATLGELATDFNEELTLERAGRRVLKFPQAAVLARRQLRPVPMTVLYRGPEAKSARVRTTSVRYARRGELPIAEVQDVRAVRRGDAIRVTWRLKGTVHEAEEPIFVTATKTRARGEAPLALRTVEVNKRRRFSVTLRAGADAKFVTVRTVGFIVGQGRTVVGVR